MTVSKVLESSQLPDASPGESWGLAALGASGTWTISVLHSGASPDCWLLEMESPAVYLSIPISAPSVIDDLIACFMKRAGLPSERASEAELPFGDELATDLSLIRDNEFEDRYFLMARTAAGVRIHLTITEPDLSQIRESLDQVRLELDGV